MSSRGSGGRRSAAPRGRAQRWTHVCSRTRAYAVELDGCRSLPFVTVACSLACLILRRRLEPWLKRTMRRRPAPLLLAFAAAATALAPTPRRARGTTRVGSTTEDATEASQRWLADQGLVAPGASSELHATARKARRNKKTKALALRPKKTRWGDAARVRDLPVEGGWSKTIDRGATTAAADVLTRAGVETRERARATTRGSSRRRLGRGRGGAGSRRRRSGGCGYFAGRRIATPPRRRTRPPGRVARRRTRIFRGERAEPRGSSVGGEQWSLSDDALRAHRW